MSKKFNRWSKEECWTRGMSVEDRFYDLYKPIDPSIRKATIQEQYQHIDHFTKIGAIDVKARKRVSRSGAIQDDLTWLEFKHTNGGAGWLYGKADFIAFERLYGFVLVARSDLASMAEEKCDLEDLVDNPRDALYKGYTRKGNKDLISMVRMEDILSLPHQVVQYQDLI